MGRDVGLEDLSDVHPDIYASLKKLLAYDSEFSELGLCFQVCAASAHRLQHCGTAGHSLLCISIVRCTPGGVRLSILLRLRLEIAVSVKHLTCVTFCC